MKGKIFSVLFALVLVVSFSLVAAVPVSVDEAQASPGVVWNAPLHFGAGGTGDAMWSLDKTHTLADDCSIYLTGTDSGNYGMFHLFPTEPMTIQDLETLKFWVYPETDQANYQMTMELVVDVNGDGHRTDADDYAIRRSPLPLGDVTGGQWNLVTALDLSADPAIDRNWHYTDYTFISTNHPFTDIQDELDDGTVEGTTTRGDGTENILRIELGGALTTWGDDETWVDDVTVNTTTYDLEAFLIPSLGVDVKGSEQKFTINGYINVGPIFDDVDGDLGSADSIPTVVDGSWTVTPGVNSPVVTVDAGGTGQASYITISAIKPGDCIVKVKLDDEDDDILPDMTLDAEKKWGEIHHTVLEAEQITDIEVGDEVDLDEMVYATIHWGSMAAEDEVVMAAGGADVYWWLVKDTTANQAELEVILNQIFGADNVSIAADGMSGEACGNYAEVNDPFTLLAHFFTTDADTVTEDKTYFSQTEGDDISGTLTTYVKTVTDDSLPPALCRDVERGWTQTSVKFLNTSTLPTKTTDNVIVIALATYPVNLHGENPVCVEFQKLTSLPLVEYKDVQTLVVDIIDPVTEEIDPIRKMLYVFVRDYDGSPAESESVGFAVDGPYGLFEALLTGTNIDSDVVCYAADTYPDGIFAASKSAVSTTRRATTAEIADFDGLVTGTGSGDPLDLDYETTGEVTGYAIAGVKIVSSHLEDVDILIYVHDCYGGSEVVITRDVMVTGFGAVTVVSISALPSEVTLDVDDTQQLTVTATYSDASTADVTATSTYVSDAETVATVSTGGLITAVLEGDAIITVSYETKTDTVSVTVGFDPWIYDTNDNDVMEIDEVLNAISDYFAEEITIANVLEVITLYF